jgi:hypothetical protein
MDIREQLERHRSIVVPIISVAILAICTVSFFETHASRGTAPGISKKAYYTTEDQLTGQAAVDALFVDDVNRVPPFDHNGKPAYRAIVYQCNSGSLKWVNTLERYKASIQLKVQAFVDSAVAGGAEFKVDTSDFDRSGLEVKSPGSGPWLGPNDPRGAEALACKAPADASVADLMFCVP